MSGLSVILIGTALALVVAALVHRWRREDRDPRVQVGIGIFLIVISLLVGSWLLPTRPAPREEPPSIGLLPPVTPKLGRGFAVGMAVRVKSCRHPVVVTLVANGTAEFWRDHAGKTPRWSTVRFVIPDRRIRMVASGGTEDPSDLVGPMYAKAKRLSFFREEGLERGRDFTVIANAVHRWERRLNPVVTVFEAEWLEPRGPGTCYLRLPKLVGSVTALQAGHALGRASRDTTEERAAGKTLVKSRRTGLAASHRPELEVTRGNTTVVVDGGEVSAEASLPAPDETVDGYSTWVCQGAPARTGEVGDDNAEGTGIAVGEVERMRSGAAYSRDYIARSIAGDCDSVAVIESASSRTLRDIWLLVLGTTFSLGASLLAQTFLDGLKAESYQRRRAPS